MRISKRTLVIGIISSLLLGCGDSGISDLEQYAVTVRARPPAPIEPLPKPRPYLPFSYTVTFMRDPFQNPELIVIEINGNGTNKVPAPDGKRPKQYLERFDIGSFSMVGTIENDNEHYALLRGNGGVHRIKVGDFIGLNYGRVISINDFGMEVIETIPDGDDGWIARPYHLELKTQS